MNTVAKGDIFEEKAYNLIEAAVQNGELGILPSAARVYKKKGYYSRDRDDDIIFDLSIEIWLPNAENYSYLWIIECKSYSSRIPVDDVEEFHDKVRQVAGLNVKGVFITNSNFSSGAFKVARSRGIMLIETYDESHKIILHKIERGNDLLPGSTSSDPAASEIEGRLRLFFSNTFALDEEKANDIPYLSADKIEVITQNLWKEYNAQKLYNCQQINLDKFCIFLQDRHGLTIENYAHLGYDSNNNRVLGEIDMEFSTIRIDHTISDTVRFAFILAHEIGHFFLHRTVRLSNKEYESFQDSSFNLTTGRYDLVNPRQWIEWQANIFASMLLMPENSLRVQLIAYQAHIGINHNRGWIFRDNQEINRKDYVATISYLASFFGVSKLSVKFRLQSLGVFTTKNHLAKWYITNQHKAEVTNSIF